MVVKDVLGKAKTVYEKPLLTDSEPLHYAEVRKHDSLLYLLDLVAGVMQTT